MATQTKDIVVGLGEIGTPILQLISKAKTAVGYDLKKELMDEKKFLACASAGTDFLHVCIPFTKRFSSNVLALAKQFKPKAIVIHSTIEPHTTKKLQQRLPIPIIYSATRGVHKRMLYDLRRYTKFYAVASDAPNSKWAATTYARMLSKCGVKAKRMSMPLTLELAKIICDTSYYGWLITYAQLSNMIAINNRVNYDEMWSFADEIHKFLGNRPKMYPGIIGGHCLDGDEIIYIKTENGMKPITIRDYVDKNMKNDILSHDPQKNKPFFDKVMHKWKRNFSGTMVTLTSRTNRSITTTDEHLMLYSDSLGTKFAKDVTIGDTIPFVAELPKHSIKYVYNFETKNWRFRYNMPESIHLTAKLCRLLGYYVAEGSVSNYGKGYTIRFSFNKNETDYITDVCDILQEIGLNHCKTSQNNVTHVCLKSTPFALFIADMLGCGRISTQKQLPDFIYFAPRSFKEEFLSGYLRGDGCFSPDSSMIQAGTASRLLVAGLDILLLSMGYVMTCGKRITSPSIIAGRTIKGGFLHTLTTKTQRQYNGLAEICEFDQVDFRTHSKQLWHTLRNVLYMIRTAKVTHEEKEQTVYSIDTQKHLFVSTNGRLIHNCVIPNLDLINDETLNFIKILNNKYMKKLRKK